MPETEPHGPATTALVLGICGLTVCPLVCSVLAIVKGRRARQAIVASDGRLTGHGQATAGLVLAGWGWRSPCSWRCSSSRSWPSRATQPT